MERSATATLTSKTLTSPTITAPTITDAVLTGEMADSTLLIKDNVDPTKILQFQVSGLTTGTTRTLTIPDADDTVCGIAATQTLTNKTLTSPVLTTPNIGVATATSINGLTVTASTGTLTVPNGVTATGPAASGTLVTETGTATLSAKTLNTPTLSTPVITAPSGSGFVISKTITFTEQAGTTCTGTVVLPAGSTLHDIMVTSSVLWGGTSAVLKVGDSVDDDGFFVGVDLKATDLLVGEVLSLGDSENWGGKNGAYLVAATGQRGPAATNFGLYYGAGSSIIGVVTMNTPSTTGRTFMTVTYSVGAVTAATVA